MPLTAHRPRIFEAQQTWLSPSCPVVQVPLPARAMRTAVTLPSIFHQVKRFNSAFAYIPLITHPNIHKSQSSKGEISVLLKTRIRSIHPSIIR